MVAKVEERFELPFKWQPGTTTLAHALEESRRFWQNPVDGAMAPGFVDALNRSLAELVQAGLEQHSVQVGERLPDVHCRSNRTPHPLDDLNRAGPLVVTFYRGGWRPYCNLALRGIQQVLPEIERLGGELVAITPEQPDDSLSTAEKTELTFDVLTDDGLNYARQLGIVWKIPDYALQWHEQYFGLHFEQHNGAGHRDELPFPPRSL